MDRPLADLLRPKSLDEVVGQEHILGKNGMLRRIVDSGRIPNMIFYGPSGVGKTTVASIIAGQTQRKLYRLNATTASIGDIKAIIDELDTFLAPNGALVYLDEIQYFNKKQQQTLLEFIENGRVTLIASTTENPYFYVYNAILSRSTVFEFKPVTPAQVKKAVDRALEMQSAPGWSQEVKDYIAASCGGDVRKAINAVELLCQGCGDEAPAMEDVKAVTQRSAMRYDRDGDEHYDILSAFQKSLRGSDPNAAIHYLARLLSAGDLISPCRRLLVTAAEDVGLAYPQCLPIVKACVDSAMQLGLPEARIPLADAVILVATAPKSNSGVCAIDSAMDDIKSGHFGSIPTVLKDAHFKGAESLGHGVGYQYAHNFPNHYVAQQYLPDEIKDKEYYVYGDNKTEQRAREYWQQVKGET